ncbi:hypothetical protein DKX38_024329 [Salix brachista]|uniref:Uncharacterized protein n=1 Tax=Salix brachista TaxID=2182728 RepID=A0A5N5JRG2_9ROSI|nr:hypothetical protein DKX38_024329 [Salix brachista]
MPHAKPAKTKHAKNPTKPFRMQHCGVYYGDPFSSRKQADMEVPDVVGWLPEVCSIDEASVIQCVASGLPPPQLESALNRTAALKAPLVVYASQPNIKSSLPRSVLVVLGIAPDPQTSSQAQTSQAQTGDTSNSAECSKTPSLLDESEVAPEEVAVPARQHQA